MSDNTRHIFEGFLKEQGALDAFITNMNSSGFNDTDYEMYMSNLHKRSPKDVLQFSFDWIRSPEGDNFWRELSHDWKIRLGYNPEDDF